MLEGETATAKTTAILWLAQLARHTAVRVHLSGHTDTGELVGRYVPSTRSGSNSPAWEFAEGYIPKALREGWWVILDEVNLAESQVLERLNPVLEMPPTLVLTEHDGRRFGPNGDTPVSENFRIFGTMNPSEYAGRATLSPAFRDRWGLWGHVSKPSEPELLDMLRHLVTGENPAFVWEGVRWIPQATEPLYPELENFPDLEPTLKAISSFHARISGAAGDNEAPATIGRVLVSSGTYVELSSIRVKTVGEGSPTGLGTPVVANYGTGRLQLQRVEFVCSPATERGSCEDLAIVSSGDGRLNGLTFSGPWAADSAGRKGGIAVNRGANAIVQPVGAPCLEMRQLGVSNMATLQVSDGAGCDLGLLRAVGGGTIVYSGGSADVEVRQGTVMGNSSAGNGVWFRSISCNGILSAVVDQFGGTANYCAP